LNAIKLRKIEAEVIFARNRGGIMKNIKYMKYVSLVLLLTLALFLIHCSGGGGDSGGSNGGSSGGSSSDSGKTMSQSTIDHDIMWAVHNSVIVLYNENVVGTPYGQKNLLGRSCPYGGTVDITGTTSKENGTTVDLNFNMTNCKTKITQSTKGVEITMTGLMAWSGSFNSTTKYKDWLYQASSIILTGRIQHSSYEDTDFTEIVDYTSHATQNGSDATNVSGTIDGRPVSMVLGSGSSGGSGGSGGGSNTEIWTGTFEKTWEETDPLFGCNYKQSGNIKLSLSRNDTSVSGENFITNFKTEYQKKPDADFCVPAVGQCVDTETNELLKGEIVGTVNGNGNYYFSKFELQGCLGNFSPVSGDVSGTTMTGTKTIIDGGPITLKFNIHKQ